ncbi:MAG: hypothetical protein KDA85_19450, partial [Planctomycetaceae bacterium]|nr:hypothetical protein [Planctomycetaceae bacterium]
GYAAALTLLLLFLVLTGRIQFSGAHGLESLPDLRPLDANEFRKVPDGVSLPEGHSMRLGESQRFGDLVFKPVKVTREPLTFEHSRTGNAADRLKTPPVLKLWFECQNVSDDYAFPAWDNWLMSSRFPQEGIDEDTQANSWLRIQSADAVGAAEERAVDSVGGARVLNYLQSPANEFLIVGQDAGHSLVPGETGTSFIACADTIGQQTIDAETRLTWRIQVRKGVHQDSGHGVTTLVDVSFSGSDIESSL